MVHLTVFVGEGELMRERLKRDLRTIVIAGVTASVMGVAPAVAVLVNADTVDGKHAVGAAKSPEGRAGKLVATNKQGLLPSNIIKKAPDSDLLDGFDSSYFRPEVKRFARTQRSLLCDTWDDDVATVQLTAPHAGVVLITVQSQVVTDADDALKVALVEDGSRIGEGDNIFWASHQSGRTAVQQWSWARSVSAGQRSYSLALRISNLIEGCGATGTAVPWKVHNPSITVTYLPGAGLGAD